MSAVETGMGVSRANIFPAVPIHQSQVRKYLIMESSMSIDMNTGFDTRDLIITKVLLVILMIVFSVAAGAAIYVFFYNEESCYSEESCSEMINRHTVHGETK